MEIANSIPDKSIIRHINAVTKDNCMTEFKKIANELGTCIDKKLSEQEPDLRTSPMFLEQLSCTKLLELINKDLEDYAQKYGKIIFIFDNIQDKETFEWVNQYVMTVPNGINWIINFDENFRTLNNFPSCIEELKPYKIEEAKKWFKKAYDENEDQRFQDDGKIAVLIDEISKDGIVSAYDLVLVINIFKNDTLLEIEEFISELKNASKEFDLKLKHDEKPPIVVYCFHIVKEISFEAFELLEYLCHLNSNFIPYNLVEEFIPDCVLLKERIHILKYSALIDTINYMGVNGVIIHQNTIRELKKCNLKTKDSNLIIRLCRAADKILKILESNNTNDIQ